VPAEHPRQLVEGRRLVVDGEHAQQRCLVNGYS
jgi:hypothetical protein